ncbi:MAG: dienelactone hydrolase family protein [Actinomycetota bacterium]|nr:dienelactone hydrolase family protein [Actinomycetota bacterium]
MASQTPLSVHAPDGQPKGGIVLVQEAFGVNDHIEDVGRRFAAEGWLTVAPHLFHRTGDPTFGYDDMSVVMPHMDALTAEGVLADIDAALDQLKAQGIPPERIGVVGFCMGGTVTLVTAARRPVGAAVTFYGGGVTEGRFGFPPLVEEAARLGAPWLGLYGDLDEGIPVEGVERLREAAAASGQTTAIVRYPEAGHGFHCDQRGSFEAKSAEDAWARTLAWFNEHLT